MGWLTDLFGATDNFQATNPYSSNQFAQALGQQSQLYGQQQQLSQALLAQANGQGPNPALAQLHQTTDQNAQAAAGLMASQRGINPALAARSAAQTGANLDQQAAGQAATLSAQQQLGAQAQLGGLYGQMGSQNAQQQGMMNQMNLGTQQINSGVAAQNSQTAGSMMGGLLGGVGGGIAKAIFHSKGGRIEGTPSVPGDSLKNDTVPAMLSPGEIVIPRSHADNAEMAKEFIDHLMRQKSSKKKSSGGGYGRVLEAHRKLGDALKAVGAQ